MCFGHGKELIRFNVRQDLFPAIRPDDFDPVACCRVTQPEMHRNQTGRGIADRTGHLVGLVADADAGADRIPIAFSTGELDIEPVVRAAAEISPNLNGGFE